jgi:proteasome lid subunit RPN8/RPN11
MKSIICSGTVIADTLEILRTGGRRKEERVALWLAKAGARTPAEVVEVYEPDQIAEVDFFNLPRESMRVLMSHLSSTRRRIVAQIHTHPGRAYHSDADAAWAIVRHVGALSLVLPTFARTTTLLNFLQQVKIYELSPAGEWNLKPGVGPDAAMEIAQ